MLYFKIDFWIISKAYHEVNSSPNPWLVRELFSTGLRAEEEVSFFNEFPYLRNPPKLRILTAHCSLRGYCSSLGIELWLLEATYISAQRNALCDSAFVTNFLLFLLTLSK